MRIRQSSGSCDERDVARAVRVDARVEREVAAQIRGGVARFGVRPSRRRIPAATATRCRVGHPRGGARFATQPSIAMRTSRSSSISSSCHRRDHQRAPRAVDQRAFRLQPRERARAPASSTNRPPPPRRAGSSSWPRREPAAHDRLAHRCAYTRPAHGFTCHELELGQV